MRKIYQMYLKLNTKKKKKKKRKKKIKKFKKNGECLRILTPKQILQWLSIALAQVKAANISENLLNAIRQIICSMHRSKKITKKVYNNITHRLLLNLPHKIDL